MSEGGREGEREEGRKGGRGGGEREEGLYSTPVFVCVFVCESYLILHLVSACTAKSRIELEQ